MSRSTGGRIGGSPKSLSVSMSLTLAASPQLRKGAWTEEEDALLRRCVETYGATKWHHVPNRAGLNRCRKSCRLRWVNYLNPSINRGNFGEDEADLIIRLHGLLGNRAQQCLLDYGYLVEEMKELHRNRNYGPWQLFGFIPEITIPMRWSLIAGRLPGRTANDVKNYWNSHLRKKLHNKDMEEATRRDTSVIKPKPRAIPMGWIWSRDQLSSKSKHQQEEEPHASKPTPSSEVNALISNVWDGMVEELQTNFRVENLEGVRDDELFLEGVGGWEDLVSDINLWG